MLTLVKQEYFKAFKQNRLHYYLLVLFAFPIFILGCFPDQRMETGILNLGQGLILVNFLGIVLTALYASQEFTYGTIRLLLSRRFNRAAVFTSKIIVILSTFIAFFAADFLGTLVAKLAFAPTFDFSKQYGDPSGTGWQVIYRTVGETMLQMIFIAGLVLLVVNIVKSSGAAIALGVVMVYGIPLLTALSSYILQQAAFLKWNPLNIFLGIQNIGRLGNQPAVMYQAMGMTVNQLIYAYVGYVVLIYAIAYYIFQRRSV
ncbi:ABC transporter permease [Eupransor demetentiae]|uniref:Permease component (NosY) n=1 Tax=Eupransor demetentiae TaxID=3109584 RepID=A0ABP0EPW4_9LACO|nr:ABC-type transport system involved in multi-copper enzyme maturation [Lactobacillaceae bacterium LMG 33000]